MVIYDKDTSFMTGIIIAALSSSIVEVFTIPFDIARVRIQHQNKIDVKLKEMKILTSPKYTGLLNTLRVILMEEGPRSLFTGLSAGIQRQVAIAALRIGFYDKIKNFYADKLYDQNRTSMQYGARMLSAVTTSTIGLCVSQPADIVKKKYLTQFQAHPEIPRFQSVSQAYEMVIVNDGVAGLWKGLGSNLKHNAVVNVCEIFLYDVIREKVLRHKLLKDDALCHLTCAAATGFFTTVITAPLDTLNKRLLAVKKNVFKNVIEYSMQIIRKEGILSLYKGTLPTFIRAISWNICMWMSFEYMKEFINIDIDEVESPLGLMDPIYHFRRPHGAVFPRNTVYPPGHPDDPRH